MDSIHERPNKPKCFEVAQAVEEVLNMLENRNASEIQVWLFIKVLTKRLTQKYNL